MEILLTGNTGYITEAFIYKAFPGAHVLIGGDSILKSTNREKITVMPFREKEEQELYEAYEFDRIIYLSSYLSYGEKSSGELEQLNSILKYCETRKNIQMIYLAGPELDYVQTTGDSVIAEAAEQLCMYYSEKYGTQVKIIRLPYLYSALYKRDYLCRLFQEMEKLTKVNMKASEAQKLHFLCMDDLAELLYRIFDSWDGLSETMTVPETFGLNFADLGYALAEHGKDAEISYTHDEPVEIKNCTGELRKRYGWFPKISLIEELPELWMKYLENQGEKVSRWEMLKRQFKKHGNIWKAAELILGFGIMELLNHMSGNAIQFKYIDFRLIFVVILGTVHGMNMGILAAALASVSFVAAYVGSGNNALTLFYEPANWIPFIFYFMVGSVCGYVRLKSQDIIQFTKKESALLKEKYLFIYGLHQDILQERRGLKKQILGSRDSFGKLFDITRQLDAVMPQEIFIRAIRILEEVLENRTISIYSIGRNRSFARLEIASRDMLSECAKSMNLDGLEEIFDSLNENGMWVNQTMEERLPMYISAVKKDSQVKMFIAVHRCNYDQMSLYYQNLIKVLCGLIEISLIRALNYEEATNNQVYVEDTRIMKENYFMEKLGLHHSMEEEKISSYTLLRLERKNMNLKEADKALETKIRENDILGISLDGTLYLILNQTSAPEASSAMKRLESAGFGCRIVSKQEEEYI